MRCRIMVQMEAVLTQAAGGLVPNQHVKWSRATKSGVDVAL
jgi:hypothetical protein